MYTWVCIFIQFISRETVGSCNVQSHSDSLEVFSRSTEVDSNSDLNTGTLQRDNLLWTSKQK